MIAVVDASALLRLYLPDGPEPEGLDALFRQVQRGDATALAPELVWAEAANVLRRKQKAGELGAHEGRQLLLDMLTLPLRTEGHPELLPGAHDLAVEHDLTVYDALYLEQANRHAATLYTCDRAMAAAAERLGLAAHTPAA